MQEFQLTRTEAIVYLVLIPAGIGFVLGLVPLIVGKVKQKTKLGILGLITGAVAGAIFGFFGSIPSMAIFTWLILRKDIISTELDTEITSREDDPQ